MLSLSHPEVGVDVGLWKHFQLKSTHLLISLEGLQRSLCKVVFYTDHQIAKAQAKSPGTLKRNPSCLRGCELQDDIILAGMKGG